MVFPEGCVKICCFASRNVMQDGAAMSLYGSSIEEIWNSSHLRSIRRSMFRGEEVFECAHCYQAEADGLDSHRINSNSRWKAELGPLFYELVSRSRLRSFAVLELPVYLQLIPGNVCNLKCRMCFPQFSSRIESDTVHSRWALGKYNVEPHSKGTKSKARPVIDLDRFRCVVNAMRSVEGLFSRLKGSIPQPHNPVAIPMEARHAEWRLRNGKRRPEYGPVALDVSSRLPKEPWYKDRSWVFEALLEKPERLRALYLTGGEPMIQREAEEIIGYLVQEGVAPGVTLELNTNGTVVKDSLINKFSKFNRIYIGLSIDAHGALYEYIRYPAKWDVISKNLSGLMSLPADKFTVTAVPILQAYNVLDIVDLLRYLDKRGIGYGMEVASEPWFITLGVLPLRVRLFAAGRLRAYADTDCPATGRSHVLSVADAIESVQDNCTRESLQAFMLFTNDLDATRGQDVRHAHPELIGMIEEEGFHWSKKRHFFPSA